MGKVWVGDTRVNDLPEQKLAQLRLRQIGFVFQGFNLLAPLNALENVMHPLLLQGVSRRDARKQALELVRTFGMEDRIHNLPRNLSGGQQQRIAIARSLITDPQLILCDEPTASLDHNSARMVMEMLSQLSLDNRAVIVVTHDVRLKKYADRTIYVSEGMISDTTIEEEF
jgi:putative ABC transport system ATP-binding protein